MKLIMFLLITASATALAFTGDPGMGNTKLCMHHVEGGGSESYALVIHPQTCPPYQGTTTSDSGVTLYETHQMGSGAVFAPTNVSTSQHCWTEEKDMGN